MNISGHTRVFAVLGHPVGHSLSPLMHNTAFDALGMDAVYTAFDVEPAKLMPVLGAMADMGFGGVNLTLPLKEAAFRGLTDLDESARLLGSVNTVEFTAAGLKGHSTDGAGFLADCRDCFGRGVEGLTVLVLGCGGAGRAVAIACAGAGAARIRLANRGFDKAEKLAREIRSFFPAAEVSAAQPDRGAWSEASRASELVIHAASVGLNPADPPLLESAAFRRGQMLYDLIYTRPQTPIMRAAAAAGARTANGLGMLLRQGARSFEIWTGRQPPLDAMRAVLEKAVYRGNR